MISIKESQKGTFTKYCKGKVTEECIKKGKNSPNSKIRKKAIFAENSRSWKHKFGGIVFSQEGSKLDLLKGIANTGLGIYQGIKRQRQINKINKINQNRMNDYKNLLEAEALSNIDTSEVDNFINNQENPNAFGGEVMRAHLLQKQRERALQKVRNQIQLENLQNNFQVPSASGLADGLADGLTNLINLGINYLNSPKQNTTPIKSPLNIKSSISDSLQQSSNKIATIRKQPNT